MKSLWIWLKRVAFHLDWVIAITLAVVVSILAVLHFIPYDIIAARS